MFQSSFTTNLKNLGAATAYLGAAASYVGAGAAYEGLEWELSWVWACRQTRYTIWESKI